MKNYVSIENPFTTLFRFDWKLEKYHDTYGYSAAVQMDLPKAFDKTMIFFSQNFMLMGFNSLKLLMSYLRNSLQQTKVGGEFSTWEENWITPGIFTKSYLIFNIHYLFIYLF